MPSGGARVGAGRKKLPPEKKKKEDSFHLTQDEEKKLREYLKKLRGQ